MVRETRHLWVGNLPDNIREDRIREHFKRYGRVQNVKLLGRTEHPSGGACPSSVSSSGICAAVAFMDIKSASKAHNAEHVLDERTLTTEYYEPAAIPTVAGAPSAGSSPAGSGYSGSSSSVNSAPAPPAATAAAAAAARYHLPVSEEGAMSTCAIAATAAAPAAWRGTNDSASEYCRRGNTPSTYGRTTGHHRWYGSGERGATGGESTPSTPGGGTEGGGRARRRSGSGSSRSDSSSEPSDGSRASTPAHHHPHHANHRQSQHHSHQWSSTAGGRPLAICVRNLPTRSTDSSLKDGLYHEYKKHGKVVWVKVVGQNADRYAVVRFKKPSDVEKALEVSQDKLFFGCKISVAPHQSCDEDAESAKPYETDIDEYHPKATRTLFIGNLEKDVTQQQLRDKFKHFGRIIEIDIKKGSGGGSGYAFCQYASISSVVEAIRAMDGEHVGGSRVKLGFGKPVATTCVWVDGLTEHTEKQVLSAVSRCGTATSVCVDRAAGAALVHFEQVAAAGAAVRELRRVAAAASAAEPELPRLCVDYASRECQEAFYEQLEKHGGAAALMGSERLSGADLGTRYMPPARHDGLRFDNCGSRSRASSYGRGATRNARYTTLDHYDPADYAADRRYRVYDEIGSSPATEDGPYEDRLQSVVVSPHRARKHRRDSSPEDRKHSKERHRSASGSVRRSRSGSRCGERHTARRRHRRRRDGSRCSRTGTPLRDEPDAPPSEPRRPPRDRPPLPMSLPLPKFAAQLLRSAPPTPRPTPAPAPASPPRPPSASSSSAGSAPHSPSLEERIRSLDEKYEKWSGSRAVPDTPDRSRLRHRLLDVDINEVKPSEVVRSLLAKRSVFDEDSERLEGATRVPSPGSSPRSRPSSCLSRTLRYPFPAHPSHSSQLSQYPLPQSEIEAETSDRPADPRLNRTEKPYQSEKLGKFNESDYRLESRFRLRTPSIDKPPTDFNDRTSPPKTDGDHFDFDRENKKEYDRRRQDFIYKEKRLAFDIEIKGNRDIENICDLVKSSREENVDSSGNKFVTSLDKNNELIQDHSLSFTDSSNIDGPNENSVQDFTQNLVKQLEDDQTYEKLELQIEKQTISSKELATKNKGKTQSKSEFSSVLNVVLTKLDIDSKPSNLNNTLKNEILKSNNIYEEHHVKSEVVEELSGSHSNCINTTKSISDFCQGLVKMSENTEKDVFHSKDNILEMPHIKSEKEHVSDIMEKRKPEYTLNLFSDSQLITFKKETGEPTQSDRLRNQKERLEKDNHEHDKDKHKINKNDRVVNKDKKIKEEIEKSHEDKLEKVKLEKDSDKIYKHKSRDDRDSEKSKVIEEKSQRQDQHRKDKFEKDRRRNSIETDNSVNKSKRDEKHKHEKSKRENNDSKRENKKESETTKVRKSSRDETRDLSRKDSTDSSTSKTSHESCKLKDLESNDVKEDVKSHLKNPSEMFTKHKAEKEMFKSDIVISLDTGKLRQDVDLLTKHKAEKELSPKSDTVLSLDTEKFKQDVKGRTDDYIKTKDELEFVKVRVETVEKQRHYSVDSATNDTKRKERLNSCSSLPPNIGHKRRISSQETLDSLTEDLKKYKNGNRCPERRDSKDARNSDRHKTTKFNKCHFAKIIESKTKDDKKNQVKPPDDFTGFRDCVMQDLKSSDKSNLSKSSTESSESEKGAISSETHSEDLHNDLDFLATLELRSSEEDEKQKALRKEMKEKKRIQQLQQIQQLQMQQDALQQAELPKIKDEKKQKIDDKKRETFREKRLSIDRKSREEKNENTKKKSRKHMHSTDSSDSDEPKKHSIFDIVDDEPTYISMYDKVKARSCKNMQKQEEEKRQEKIKAKFSQLKQSRAKREEKKRSSWDEDSDSEPDRRKTQKSNLGSSSDDEDSNCNKKHENMNDSNFNHKNNYFDISSNQEETHNKLCRKNSRTRIMSDTSDDEVPKRSMSKSPSFLNDSTKELRLNPGLFFDAKDNSGREIKEDKVKKNSLLSLFGKSDSDDSKVKLNFRSDNKSSFVDFSSESESLLCRHPGEIRKKHKKKQKKHKISFSEDEKKNENKELPISEESKRKQIQKARRHSNKKEKRKEKNRDSFDTDDNREDKSKYKKNKKSSNDYFETISEASSNNVIRKEGKMEDIFGPLSDESDKESDKRNSFSTHNYDPIFCTSDAQSMINRDETKSKDKDEKRKKDKKRKEKRYFSKEDENSLDIDAASKAIEAELIADTLTDYEPRIKLESLNELCATYEKDEFKTVNNSTVSEKAIIETKVSEKNKRDSKDKKKKKKKNKEERLNRKDHIVFNHEKTDKFEIVSRNINLSPHTVSEIPLPKEKEVILITDNTEEYKFSFESHSLPRLTDTPPLPETNLEVITVKISDVISNIDSDTETEFEAKHIVEVDTIPMPPPIENFVQDIRNVPLPDESAPVKPDQSNTESSVFDIDIDMSENAVRSISNLENNIEKKIEVERNNDKLEEKIEEKPRAMISQEETEDAVAALLGESFGGKANAFENCYEDAENNSTHRVESTPVESENIPEEDAEEMRQAVQNLNASEMEIKPDTPVSDNDLLLIDTDTEEPDENTQDAIERLPINIIATNQSLNVNTEEAKSFKLSEITPKPKETAAKTPNSETNDGNIKLKETGMPYSPSKREIVSQSTSTATPVITSWTLTNNKLLEPQLLNIQKTQLPRDANDTKPTHLTTNIVQIKTSQNQNLQIANTLRPIISPNRAASYQVLNQIIRPQSPNMQPPTIKIPPEPHILYQKPQGIVISPRISNDPRLQSPKAVSQGETVVSPRLTNMAILTTSPQNFNTVGMPPSNTLQTRSPGHVTVVRMQQPPLSPIQAMHLPHATRSMLSPNRPNSVLVQTQGAPIHFNRLPVTPVLAPISKQINPNNNASIVQQSKGIVVSNSSLIQQQKFVTGDRMNDQRPVTENINDSSKIILPPTNFSHSTNPTVMAQNRLISLQNNMHVGNLNTPLQLSNKVLLNNINQVKDKKESQFQKSEQHNHMPFVSTPMLHITGVNPSSASIIQSTTKPVMCTLKDTSTVNRGQVSNVIHTLNSHRILTTSPITNVLQIDKSSPSVLSMATIRSPTVVTKLDSSSPLVVTTTSLTNVVMTPLLLKTTGVPGTIRLNKRNDNDITESNKQNYYKNNESKFEDKLLSPNLSSVLSDPKEKQKELVKKNIFEINPSVEHVNKCETDFEELLKDNTNEIKVSNDPDKKLEVNVGNTVTLFSTSIHDTVKQNLDQFKKEVHDKQQIHTNFNVDFNTVKPENEDANESPVIEKIKEETIDSKSPETSVSSVKQENKTHTDKNNSQIDSESHVHIDEDEKPLNLLLCSTLDNEKKDVECTKLLESVIKKTDGILDEKIKENKIENCQLKKEIVHNKSSPLVTDTVVESHAKAIENTIENVEINLIDRYTGDKVNGPNKRGGRNARGKKAGRNTDRIQTRQISKPPRGTATSKRGRGRAKVDKKLKKTVNNKVTNLPGDIYDFHEDSGDESTSPQKTETRPRLILTIKSPLSGNSNSLATSTLSITHKDLPKNIDFISKEEKSEDFASPSLNIRKSRRLQKKDVQKNTSEDITEDSIKLPNVQNKQTKEVNKGRPARQKGKVNNKEKVEVSDTRKSPRGTKRARDRSLSDASMDSSDEKITKKEMPKESKILKLSEQQAPFKAEPNLITPKPTTISSSPSTSTPIMKPPKKMISEISAKLAGAFDAASPALVRSVVASVPDNCGVDKPAEGEKQTSVVRNPDLALSTELKPAATGESHVRRLGESVPSGLMPVGASEAADARVLSPALPHRPPSSHRPADRATPILVRTGEGEVGGVCGAAATGSGSRLRTAYAGTASLPLGAHHPPPAPAAVPLQHPKQVAVVSPHQHHQHIGAASLVNIASVPSVSPQGQVPMGEGMYPHFSHQHYQMYQQHFHATQHENRSTPSTYIRNGVEEGSEAPTPPMDLLRRPPSARVPRPAHSPAPSPAPLDRHLSDRHIMYAVGCGRSPPPAHGTSRLPAALPPPTAPGPPHASQVPREADSLQMLLRRYPVMWQGLLALKNDSAAVQMHFVGGNPAVAGDTLPRHTDGSTPPLRIAQRMRLEPAQLDQVHRKMKLNEEHCILLALPCGRDHMDVLLQSTNLTAGFITYLQRKQAAGIVNVAPPGHQQAFYTVHIFPSCDFANENLNRIAPDLMHRVADIAHLLIVIATV